MSELRIPDGFIVGAATSAYQVEGSVAADGRGESIWDRFSRTPGKVRDGDTGDLACDSYRRLGTDLDLVADLGLQAYRFSIPWPRVLPDGTGRINAPGLDWCDRLVDGCLSRGLEPFPTLYHWDLPQALEDAGGWPARATAEAFAAYADLVMRRIGDRVRTVATLNEPLCSAWLGYETGLHAPGRTDRRLALAASHHLLLGHGLAVAAIRAAAPRTKVGVVLNIELHEPASADPLDVAEAAFGNARANRWYLEPIMGMGYPEEAAAELAWDRREVHAGDLETIAAPLDWMGVNHYRRVVARSSALPPLADATEGVERTGFGWEVHPQGLADALEFVARRTGDLPLYVTENGAAFPADPDDPGRDPERVSYLRRHVAAALDTIGRGVPLAGYFAWSLLDNFEWSEGYSQRFGVVHVDFATQERRVRESGRYLSALARRDADAAERIAGALRA